MSASLSLSLILLALLQEDSPVPSKPLGTWSRFGWSSCWVGDVDGDGTVDLAVSDHTYQGPQEDLQDGSGAAPVRGRYLESLGGRGPAPAHAARLGRRRSVARPLLGRPSAARV